MVNKTNKQLRALINWAKKYADCDSRLVTTIEGRRITIALNPEGINNEYIQLMVWEYLPLLDDSEKCVEVWCFDFDKQKWRLDQDNWNKNKYIDIGLKPEALCREY